MPSPLTATGEPLALAVSKVAAAQHGVFRTHDAIRLGISTTWLTRSARRGFVERMAPSVWRVCGSPPTDRQALLIAVLAGGPRALASGDSALGLWCPAELSLPAIHQVTLPRGRSYSLAGVQTFHRSDLGLAKPTLVDAIPVTGTARALLDASPGRTVDEVVALIDVCRRHLPGFSDRSLVEALHDHARCGRPGITTFRQAVLRVRPTVSASDFERRVIADLVTSGLPEPRLHHRVMVGGGRSIELDIDWDGVLLDVELDGRDHRERQLQASHDRWRDRTLQALGYQVIRYEWFDYVGERETMLAEIARFYEQAPRRLRSR